MLGLNLQHLAILHIPLHRRYLSRTRPDRFHHRTQMKVHHHYHLGQIEANYFGNNLSNDCFISLISKQTLFAPIMSTRSVSV